MLMAFDKNNDGKLTKAEVPERLQACSRAPTTTGRRAVGRRMKKAAAAQPQPTPAAAANGGAKAKVAPASRADAAARRGRDALFSALNQDGDGSLSADEIAAAPLAEEARRQRRRHPVAGNLARRAWPQ